MSPSPVVVSGALANKPGNGGEAWVRMAWVLGLRRLGFDVWFVEQIDAERVGFPDVDGHAGPTAFFRSVVRDFGLEERAALVDDRGDTIVGPAPAELEEIAAEAALLVNISGHLRLPALFDRFPRKAYIDLDPGFTQFWHASGIAGARLAGHDLFFTVGLEVGGPECPIPAAGIDWRPLPPPVVLEQWPVRRGASAGFTTVASWRGSFGTVEHEGRTYGTKAHEFRRFVDLPRRTPAPLEIALDIHPADRADLRRLRHAGWRIVDPAEVTPDPNAYRSYIQGSVAELSVAQGVYVDTGSGWFSDRTARYLASGKPALVQDTGFSRHYPVGEGLVPFRTLEEAVTGIERIVGDYGTHSRAARRLAETHFDSDIVLGGLVEAAEVSP